MAEMTPGQANWKAFGSKAGGSKEYLEAETPQPDLHDYDEVSDRWKTSAIDLNEETLKIQGMPVMEAWEDPYMKRLAEISSSGGGKVLEGSHVTENMMVPCCEIGSV